MAGIKWYYKFMRRHENLLLRQPGSISLNRIKRFNRGNVEKFFTLLENLCDKYNIDATTVFIMDESGFSTVAKKCQKIVTKKGCKAVGSVVSGERGVNTTIVCCLSAAEFYVPPTIIFKRKQYTAVTALHQEVSSKYRIQGTSIVNFLSNDFNTL